MNAVLTGTAFVAPPDAPATISDLLLASAKQNAAVRLVEIDHAGKPHAASVAELSRRSRAIQHALGERAEPGERDVVLGFERALDFVPAIWASIHGGYSCLPWQLTRQQTTSDIRAKLEFFAAKLRRPVLLATPEIIERLAAFDPLPFEAVLATNADGAADPVVEARAAPLTARDSGALLIMTSGTTGTSKIAVIPHRSLLNRYLSRPEHAPGKTRLFCFPFDGVTGLWFLFPGRGDSLFLQPERFAAQPVELLRAIESFSVSALSLSTSMAAHLLDAVRKDSSKVDLTSLETIGLGAEMISPRLMLELAEELRARGVPDLKISFGYGMTETGPLCATPRMTVDELARYIDNTGAGGSLGGCTVGWSLRIVDDAGATRPEGREGEIEVYSPAKLFAGYLDEPELNARSFTADGWFKTGDLGVVEDGALRITGRVKSTIIINAKKIALESIEAPLKQLEGIHAPFVAAAAVRFPRSATDELAIFFVAADGASPDEIGRRIVREISRQRLAVPHLVPLKQEQFPLTASGKVKRSELAALYESGELTALRRKRGGRAGQDRQGGTERWLAATWQSLLDLDFVPGVDDDFIELGADSFASAELIFAVEEKFACSLPVESFFERPTIANLAALIEKHRMPPAESAGGATSSPATGRVLHRIQAYVGGWKGHRLFEDSLVIGFNVAGRRPPIFWVFQSHVEAKALAKQLGPDQPLYAVRSCVQIVRIRDYTTEIVETVCNRYLWEILALRPEGELIVGGNCQGGILALAIARRLNQTGAKPLRLVLLEWSYSYGAYAEPTLLIYADQSQTAKIYTEPGEQKINWRRDFARATVASIPGRHGALFSDKATLASLAGLLTGEHGRKAAPRPAWSRLRLWS